MIFLNGMFLLGIFFDRTFLDGIFFETFVFKKWHKKWLRVLFINFRFQFRAPTTLLHAITSTCVPTTPLSSINRSSIWKLWQWNSFFYLSAFPVSSRNRFPFRWCRKKTKRDSIIWILWKFMGDDYHIVADGWERNSRSREGKQLSDNKTRKSQ